MRLVQGQMGIVLADYADRPDASGHRSRYRCRQARVRCDDADDKDRHRCNRGGPPRLRLPPQRLNGFTLVRCWHGALGYFASGTSFDFRSLPSRVTRGTRWTMLVEAMISSAGSLLKSRSWMPRQISKVRGQV